MLAEIEDSDDEAKGKRCIEARFGWLLTLSCSGEVTLLNPFSRAQIQLPNFTTFPAYWDDCDPTFTYIQRAVLSANPADTDNDHFVLIVLTNLYLGFWRCGEKNWNRIESSFGAFLDVNYYNRKFYAINTCGMIWVWDDLAADADRTVAHVIFTVDLHMLIQRQAYLVESTTGGLLLITRNGNGWKEDNTYGATHFSVFGLDVIGGEWKEISSLGNGAIFAGHNAAVSIAAPNFPNVIKSNCIYFSDDSTSAYFTYSPCRDSPRRVGESKYESEEEEEADVVWPNEEDGEVVWEEWKDEWEGGNIDCTKGGGKDMGVYNVEDGSIERFGEDAGTFKALFAL